MHTCEKCNGLWAHVKGCEDERDLSIHDHPSFTEGQLISFNAGDGCHGAGKIRGKSVSGLVDFWIIEVSESNIDPKIYPWSCITMPHTLIKAE